MLLSGLGAPPSFASDLHFNVGRVESRMLLKGVTMINHLKSKILITGRNFCYLRSPLVARKKKKKNYHRLFSSQSRVEEGGAAGEGLSCCFGCGGAQGFHPCKRPSPRQALGSVAEIGITETGKGRLGRGWNSTCGCPWRPLQAKG